MIAVGQLGGGERQPDTHPLLSILSQPGLDTGLFDGGQHVAVSERDAELQIGAGGAPSPSSLPARSRMRARVWVPPPSTPTQNSIMSTSISLRILPSDGQSKPGGVGIHCSPQRQF